MKKELNRINMFFILLLLMIYAFVTYLFIDTNIEFIHFIIISLSFAIIVTAYSTNVITGLVISAISVFALGTYLFYADYLVKSDGSRYVFFWILAFPLSALLAGYFGGGISKLSDKVEFLEDELTKLITKDELTGFDNIREFYTELDEKMSSSKRHRYALSLMLIEIGHYSDMYAIYGKIKLDDYTKLLSQLISNAVRLEDKRYRIYEDTFAIVMQHTDHEGAEKLKKRINDTFEALNIHDPKTGYAIKFGIKIVCVQYDAKIKSSLEFRDSAVSLLEKQ
jgi:diguanylate cyclase (GGDEF)-like protein